MAARGGTGMFLASDGAAGAGGAGVVGADLTIINSGTITGGLTGLVRRRRSANAITFTGGTNGWNCGSALSSTATSPPSAR